ncbi:RNAse III [Coriobacterium glomerans PW2]|uniref:Ribonuclease 3 n=1 Tax=Coriobacterium glomerans (strain ATCC 49209 / DSM 20642 / JCM 10262 / PW2) TaxID=700015 RepID=F2N9Q7_CORGP|nr:ribonuclease III [Coriobacterium glomerans]AEB07160.1 RNAse III [Coriobacterium glomerans PW2]
MQVSEKLRAAEQICHHRFADRQLLRCALTHPSAVEGQPVCASYERLEFLGDSILGAIVAVALFNSYPSIDEGRLTRLKVSLVSGAMLSDVGLELGIDRCIIFGASETGTGARGMHSALENVYESLVAAMYLDGGWDVAEAFILRTLEPHLADDRPESVSNPKSILQERVQEDHGEPPCYKLVGMSGPAHEPTFTAVVLVDGVRCGRGTGSSKKEAEASAARDALERMGCSHQGVSSNEKLG